MVVPFRRLDETMRQKAPKERESESETFPPPYPDVMGSYAQSAAAREVPLPAGNLEILLSRMAVGDEDALGGFYDATNRRVFGLVLRIVRDRAAAEEALLDVYNQAWQQAGRFDSARGHALSWILTLARSRAIDLLRSRSSRVGREVDLEAAAPIPDHSMDPEESALFNQAATRIERALATLTKAQREVIVAAFFEGMTHSEIAEALGKPLGTIKTRIRSGLAALREAITKEQGSFA